MRKFKRIIASMLSLSVLLPSIPALAYTDVDYNSNAYEAIYRLGDLGIVSGYDDGSFKAGNTITRAEFARIIVSALGKDTEAKSTGFVSAFSDIAAGAWYAPYINYVSSHNIVMGYSNGSFQPNKTISFAECLTILLRVMDYKEDTVGYYWPNNYIDAARTLGISEGISYSAGDAITRGDAALMLDRALFSDLNGQEDKLLIEKASYTVIRDVVVVDSANGGREVRLSDAKTYSAKMTFDADIGVYADYAVVDKNSNLVALKSQKGSGITDSMTVYVNAITDNTISYVTNGRTGAYTFTSGFEVYADGSKQTFSQAKNSIKAGADITFYGEGGGWDFAVVGGDDVTPVIARRNYTAADTNFEGKDIELSGLTVYRDGKAATLSDIAVNDVVYYNTRSNVMDVYSKKATGIYYDAQPSKSFAKSVTVGGKSYEIGYDAAAQALGANANSFQIGERVTLLLGKGGKAVFATELSDTVLESYGVVTATGTQIAESGMNEGSTEIYADVFMPDGDVHRIVTVADYKQMIGQLVHIGYEGTKAKLTAKQKQSGMSGELDTKNRTLNGNTILKNAVVIQRTAYDAEKSAECEILTLETMTAKKIEDKNLLGIVEGNAFGDIAIIYVEDVETTASFGVVKKVVSNAKGSVTGYTIYSGGVEKTYSTNFTVAGLSAGMPVMFKLTGGESDMLKQLFEITSGTVAAADSSRIKVGSKIYQLSPDVQIINIGNLSDFTTVSIDDLTSGNLGKVTLYSDTSATGACVIRVITIR